MSGFVIKSPEALWSGQQVNDHMARRIHSTGRFSPVSWLPLLYPKGDTEAVGKGETNLLVAEG